MVLKHDCVRDTMLYLEENLTIDNIITTSAIKINKYDIDDIIYTIEMLNDAGYISAKYCGYDDKPIYSISSLTWDGHQFLDNIRDNEVWKKTKTIASKFSSTSLNLISNIAAQVISNLISNSI